MEFMGFTDQNTKYLLDTIDFLFALYCLFFFYKYSQLCKEKKKTCQLSERPVSGPGVYQSQDREGTGCCRHQTDGPNGPCSLQTRRSKHRLNKGISELVNAT